MSDIKSGMRDAEADAKETWRKADGESVGDKVADAGDRARNAVADAGDKIHEESDKLGRDAAYERGRAEGSVDHVDDTGV
ncbi:MAG TPA: hypothetical protein VGI98_01340 [Candidatus Limnocylindrales bacterium]|jgi:vacuolar-type H+-ATPase subunit H